MYQRVIASAAKQSSRTKEQILDCFVANAPRNDEEEARFSGAQLRTIVRAIARPGMTEDEKAAHRPSKTEERAPE
jgi:hypothetical protein